LKTAILLLTAVLSWSAPAGVYAQGPTTLEYPYIYKSTRAMGMGGAYTAVGGRVDTLFYNPAGLSNIRPGRGWEVNGFPIPINVSAEVNKGGQDFATSLMDALNLKDRPDDPDAATRDERLQALNDLLTKHRGEKLHLRFADFPSIGRNYGGWAFGAGGLGSLRVDAIAHQGFGSDGFFEANADITYGVLGGLSTEAADSVFAGLSLKFLHRTSLVHNFTAREMLERQVDLKEFMLNEFRRSGEALGLDAGVIWKFAPGSRLRPALGMSVMNIGDLNFRGAGRVPQTVNAGLSVNPRRALIAAIDYVDVLNGYRQDRDPAKRLRYGAELQAFDDQPAALALRAGMYQGALTLGAELRILIVTISYAKYSEETGAFAGQDKDERQLLTVNVGW
jgi:hypothetical protein